MDKSIKLLIGVISLAGLLALLIPSNLPTPPKPEAATEAVDAPVLEKVVIDDNVDTPVEDMEPADSLEEEEFFKFGEPTIDGKPYGASDEAPSDANIPTNALPVGMSDVDAPQGPMLQTDTDIAVPDGN